MALFLAFLTVNNCFPQVILSGTLSDNAGKGIEYADIQIAADKLYFLTSDSSGHFAQSFPAPGMVQIKTYRINYLPWDSVFFVKHDTCIRIILKENLKKMDEVVVVAGKRNESNAIRIKHDDFILRSESLGEADILSILQKQAGIAHTSEVSPGIYVRGMQHGNTGIFYGNSELFGINHILSIYPQFNSDAISDITIVKADFDPHCGGYISSYLKIEPDHKLYSAFSGNAEIGILNTKLSLSVPLIKNKVSTKLSLRRSYFDIIAAAYNHNESNKLPEYGFSEINNSLVWKTQNRGIISFDILGTIDKIDFNDKDIMLSGKWKNYLASGNWKLPLTSRTNLELSGGYTWFDLNVCLSNMLDRNVKNKIAEGDLSAKINFKVSTTIQTESGAEVKKSSLNLATFTDDLETEKPTEIYWKVPSGNFALFESVQWFPEKNLKLKGGLRAEIFHSDTVFFNLNPYISANYDLKGYSINLSCSKQTQYKQLYVPTGINLPLNIWCPSQTDLPPEKATHYNLSVSKNYFERLNISLSAYYVNIETLSEFIEGNFFTSLSFLSDHGHGYSMGLETSFAWKSGSLEIEGDFSVSKSRRKFRVVNDGNWLSPPFDIRYKADLNILYKWNDSWTLSLSQFVQDGFIMTLPTSIYVHQSGDADNKKNYEIVPVYTTRYNFRMPVLHRLDLSASYKFDWLKTKAAVSFGLYNAYNHQNPYYIYFTTKARDDSRVYLQARKKSLLPVVPFASLKMSF